MQFRSRALVRWLAVASLLGPTLAACTTDSGGHLFLAINQSDRDVIVRADPDERSVRLAAHTRTSFSAGWGYLSSWRITVLDGSCSVLGSVPVAGQGTVVTIAADGSLSTGGDRRRFDSASERWDSSPTLVKCPEG